MNATLEYQGERYRLTYPCKWCNGTGRFDWQGSAPIKDEECAACHGTGEVERQLEAHEIDYR